MSELTSPSSPLAKQQNKLLKSLTPQNREYFSKLTPEEQAFIFSHALTPFELVDQSALNGFLETLTPDNLLRVGKNIVSTSARNFSSGCVVGATAIGIAVFIPGLLTGESTTPPLMMNSRIPTGEQLYDAGKKRLAAIRKLEGRSN